MNDNAKRLLRSALDSTVNVHARTDIMKALEVLNEFERDVPFRVRSGVQTCVVFSRVQPENTEAVTAAVLAALGDPND